MRKYLISVGRTVMLIGVAGALGFGSLRALDSGKADCPSDPPTYPGASCDVPADCEAPCLAQPGGWWWDCDTEGCCVCAVR